MVIARFKSIVTGLHVRSRRGITDGLSRFIEADNHSAVDMGGLRRGTISINVKKPQFCEAFPEAVIREAPASSHCELLRWARSGLSSTQSIFSLSGGDCL